jgi:hypothetical protein
VSVWEGPGLMYISLTMYFDEEEYKSNYPDLSDEQLIQLFKEDFTDTVYKQWTDNDVLESLEVSY